MQLLAGPAHYSELQRSRLEHVPPMPSTLQGGCQAGLPLAGVAQDWAPLPADSNCCAPAAMKPRSSLHLTRVLLVSQAPLKL